MQTDERHLLVGLIAATLGGCSVLAGALAARRGLDLRSAAVRANDIPLVLLLTAFLNVCAALYPELIPSGAWYVALFAYELAAGVVVGHGAAGALGDVIKLARGLPGEDLDLRVPRPHVPLMYYVALVLLVPLWPLLVPLAATSS